MDSVYKNVYPIDVAITWVNGDDPDWKKEHDKWAQDYTNQISNGANTEIRYKNWENLKYWFRSIERNMPWVNRIFFITSGHLPEFLDCHNPRIKIVKHSDYIPSEYLPTFNSNTIEMNLWRLEELSDNFILFNDDWFTLQEIEPTYYFCDNVPCDEAIESPIMPVDVGEISGYACRVKINNLLVLNKHFNKRDVQRKNYDKWFCNEYGEILERNERLSYWNNFCGFHDPHLANSLKKSTLKKLWDEEYELLDKASRNRFRCENDISWYLARYWQLCIGDFVPRKTLGKSLLITERNYKEISDIIRNKTYQMISLGEKFSIEHFEEIRDTINSALEEIYSEKSSFEL